MERTRVTADVALPREPKQERSRLKQQKLMAAAAELFAEPGFEHVTADEIAAHAGYGTGTFYNYFANKTQAFLMVAGQHEQAIAPTLGAVQAELGEDSTLDDVVRSIILGVITSRAEVPWVRRTWLRLALTDPEVDAVQRRLDAEWDAAIAALVEQVVEVRGTRVDVVDPAVVATTIRVLVDALADEVVLRQTVSAGRAATTAATLITGLIGRDG